MRGGVFVNPDRLWQRIMRLAKLTDRETPWTRRAFTPLYLEGRAWLTEQFEMAGLTTRIDAAGNLIGRLAGANADAAPILIGSHSDTVPAGGRFDGMLGVLAALEAVQCVKEAGVVPKRPVEVVDFLSEEASDFGLSCIGSRALSGCLTTEMLQWTRPDGMTLAEGIALVGGRPGELDAARREAGSIGAYLEVHIEQGRVLESSGTDIGIVTDIAGIRRDLIVIDGRADHSGTTPMEQRHDALVGAARIIDVVYRQARQHHVQQGSVVATVGKLAVTPNAGNTVPGRVEMLLEVRSGHASVIDDFVRSALVSGGAIVNELGLRLVSREISSMAPTPCEPFLQDTIETAARQQGLSTLRMSSGAGHDGVFVAALGPVGMIFTPCRDGRSHCPDEWADRQACANGANVLLAAMMRFDERSKPSS